MIYKDIQMKKAINIRLDEELLAELDRYAEELERSRTYLIEKAISAYFDRLDEMISDKRIDEVKSSKVELYTLEEVAKQLGLH
jgi:predicted transcriptional regulator